MGSNQLTQKELEDWIVRLKHENYQVRYEAARMLGNFGDARAIAPLIEALGDFDKRDDESRVNRNASSSLLRIGEAAIPPLIEALKKDPSHKEDEWRRYWVTYTLKYFGGRAVELLTVALGNEDSDIAGGAAKILRHPKHKQKSERLDQELQRYEARKAEYVQKRIERRKQRAESRVSSAKVTTQSNRNEMPKLDESSSKVGELAEIKSERVQAIPSISDIPCSELPDEVLKGLFYELRHPVNSLMGCLAILQMPFEEKDRQDTIAFLCEVAKGMEELRLSAHNYLTKCFVSEVNEPKDDILLSSKEDLERFINELEEPINAVKDASVILKESTDEKEQLRAMLKMYMFLGYIQDIRASVRNHHIQPITNE